MAERLRAEMVQRQLRDRGVADARVLDAIGRLPRELFVPAEHRAASYSDEALPIGGGQTISQPYMVARMTELIEPAAGKRVLEIGTGSGYQAALLATLGCVVLSVERQPDLAETARRRIEALGLAARVTLAVGDGSAGWPSQAPFDGIVVTAGAPAIPPALPDQLGVGGRLVVPVGRRELQELVLVVRRESGFERVDCGPCVFVPLVGEGGYRAGHVL